MAEKTEHTNDNWEELSTLPDSGSYLCLNARDGSISNFLNPGANSEAAYAYRASITTPTMPVESPTEVTGFVSPSSAPPEPEPEITVAQEPIYVPPEPAPECIYSLFRSYDCIDGKVVML